MSAPDDARASGFAVPDVAIDIALVSAVLIKIADTIRGLPRAPTGCTRHLRMRHPRPMLEETARGDLIAARF
jgi:hypothetical protein